MQGERGEYVQRDRAGFPFFGCRRCAGVVLTIPEWNQAGRCVSEVHGVCTTCGTRYCEHPGGRKGDGWTHAPPHWVAVWNNEPMEVATGV